MFFTSCTNESIPHLCTFESNESTVLTFFNNSYEYNCGIQKYNLVDSLTIKTICQEIANMEQLKFFTSTNLNYWYVEIKANDSNWTTDYLTLVNTQNNGYIFKIGTSKYRNDELAKVIVNLLEIKGMDDSKPCAAQ